MCTTLLAYLPRYNDFELGAAEHKLPLLYVVAPDWLLQRNPSWQEGLAANQRRLVTARDCLHAFTPPYTPLHIRTHPYTSVRPLTHAHRCSTSTGRCACCSRGPTRHQVTRRPRYLSRCPRGAPAPTRASPTCTARAATRRRSGASRRSWRRRTAGRRRLPQVLLLDRPKRKRRLRLVSSRTDLFSCEIAARGVATPACTPGQGVHGAAQVQGAARPRDCESGGDGEGESSLYLFAYDDRKSRTPHATQSTPVSHTVSIII